MADERVVCSGHLAARQLLVGALGRFHYARVNTEGLRPGTHM
jgi:hypothetical protein